jgi:Fe-S cluster biosynthesis and repair protein YggX
MQGTKEKKQGNKWETWNTIVLRKKRTGIENNTATRRSELEQEQADFLLEGSLA